MQKEKINKVNYIWPVEKQEHSKPWVARFRFYRRMKGGVWFKYAYSHHPHSVDKNGWYWSNEDFTKTCECTQALVMLEKEIY